MRTISSEHGQAANFGGHFADFSLLRRDDSHYDEAVGPKLRIITAETAEEIFDFVDLNTDDEPEGEVDWEEMRAWQKWQEAQLEEGSLPTYAETLSWIEERYANYIFGSDRVRTEEHEPDCPSQSGGNRCDRLKKLMRSYSESFRKNERDGDSHRGRKYDEVNHCTAVEQKRSPAHSTASKPPRQPHSSTRSPPGTTVPGGGNCRCWGGNRTAVA